MNSIIGIIEYAIWWRDTLEGGATVRKFVDEDGDECVQLLDKNGGVLVYKPPAEQRTVFGTIHLPEIDKA